MPAGHLCSILHYPSPSLRDKQGHERTAGKMAAGKEEEIGSNQQPFT